MLKEISDGLLDTKQRLDWYKANPGQLYGISTGYMAMDKAIGGLEPSELIVIGARPGEGKTALALSIAHNIANQCDALRDECVLFCSLEMTAQELQCRLAGMISELSYFRLKTEGGTEYEFERFQAGLDSVAQIPIYLIAKPSAIVDIKDSPLSQDTIAGNVRTLLAKGRDIKCIVVDYLQICGDDPDNIEHERIGKIAYKLKGLAMETGIPIIACVQLNRPAFGKDETLPSMNQIKSSSTIEQAANVIMLLWRQDKNLSPGQPGYNRDLAGKLLVIVAKSRNGPTGHFRLRFSNDSGGFTDC